MRRGKVTVISSGPSVERSGRLDGEDYAARDGFRGLGVLSDNILMFAGETLNVFGLW